MTRLYVPATLSAVRKGCSDPHTPRTTWRLVNTLTLLPELWAAPR